MKSPVKPIQLAYSPCPNDTYIFHAWVHGLLKGTPTVHERLADIDELNRLAAQGAAEVAKVSFHAVGHIRDRYALLHAGGALGRGCGPLLVVRQGMATRVGKPASILRSGRILVPGAWTTASLLLRLFAPDHGQPEVARYDDIMPAVAAGEADVGLIIHESRFTYQEHGLTSLVDLGEWWERETGGPLPLGGIVIRRDLVERAAAVDAAIRASLEHAHGNPEASRAYIGRHAQEMDPNVCRRHIDLYVTDFSLDYGEEGVRAIRRLLGWAEEVGAVKASRAPLFWDEETHDS